VGTTLGTSVYEDIGFCGEQITVLSVWYTVVGTGSDTAIGLRVGMDNDIKIYDGALCLSPGKVVLWDPILVCFRGYKPETENKQRALLASNCLNSCINVKG
jgi:hypothetical protein